MRRYSYEERIAMRQLTLATLIFTIVWGVSLVSVIPSILSGEDRAPWVESPVREHSGKILFYNPGVMSSAVRVVCTNRIDNPHAARLDCDWARHPNLCRIATPYYFVGEWVWLEWSKGGIAPPEGTRRGVWCLQTDISAPEHRQGHIDRGIIAEVSGEYIEYICGAERTNCYGWIGR